MKKFAVLFIFFLLIMLPGRALSQIPKFTFGPKIGFSSSSLTTNVDTLTEKFRMGLMGGVFVRFNSKYFYIQPEVLMVSKGGIFESQSQAFREDVFINSIDVPVMFGLRLLPHKEFCIRLHGGPFFSYIIDKTITVNGNDLASAVADKQLKDAYVGYQAGVGFDLLQFSVDFRLEQGLGNIHKVLNGGLDDNWTPRLYNISLALKLL